jgi:hypothetical protein
VNLDDLKELDDFQEFKEYIKTFIIENENLFRMIYFPTKNPLDTISYPYPQDPYQIFDSDSAIGEDGKSEIHGVVLFKQKNDKILNSSLPILLIDFHTTKLGTNNIYDNLYIAVRFLCKGEYVQELENGMNRSFVIANMFDNLFNFAKFNDVGKVHRQSFDPIPINEQNIGYSSIYKCRVLANHLLDNKNYLQDKYGVDSREYL